MAQSVSETGSAALGAPARLELWGSFDGGSLVDSLLPSVIDHELRRRGIAAASRYRAPIGATPAGGLRPLVPVTPFAGRGDGDVTVVLPDVRGDLLRSMLADHDRGATGEPPAGRRPPSIVELDETVAAADLLTLIERVFPVRERAVRRAELVLRGDLRPGRPEPLVIVVGRDTHVASTILVEAVARWVETSPRPVYVAIDGSLDGVSTGTDAVTMLCELHGVDAELFATADPFDVVALLSGAAGIVAATAGSATLAAALGRPHCVVIDLPDHPVPDALVDDPDEVQAALERTVDPDTWAAAIDDRIELVDGAVDALVVAIAQTGSAGADLASGSGSGRTGDDDLGVVVAALQLRAANERERWITRVERLEAELAASSAAVADALRLRSELERMRTALIRAQAGYEPVEDPGPKPLATATDSGDDTLQRRVRSQADRTRVGRLAVRIARRLRT